MRTEYEAHRPTGNVARTRYPLCRDAWLVGLHTEIAPVLSRTLLWLDEAIAKGESASGDLNVHQSNRREARALGGWLLDGSNDADMWQQALIAQRASWLTDGGVWPDATILEWGP